MLRKRLCHGKFAYLLVGRQASNLRPSAPKAN